MAAPKCICPLVQPLMSNLTEKMMVFIKSECVKTESVCVCVFVHAHVSDAAQSTLDG